MATTTPPGPENRQQDEQHDKSQTRTTEDLPEESRPSLMQRKIIAADIAKEEAKADWNRRSTAMPQKMERGRNRKGLYFFYGSLMDPTHLQRVLGLKYRPRNLEPAEVIGYHIRMWGPYPALLDGPPGSVVKGRAYEVEAGDDQDKLAHYETDNYKEHKCIIRLEGGGRIFGTTFQWAGDVDELKDGSFDLKDWQMSHLLDN
ncbi:hypothetical protein diail_2675 [Diaporthe ilicicola]|nr:hypothetical protein diail_2675 [Diaporthe ilicicola]